MIDVDGEAVDGDDVGKNTFVPTIFDQMSSLYDCRGAGFDDLEGVLNMAFGEDGQTIAGVLLIIVDCIHAGVLSPISSFEELDKVRFQMSSVYFFILSKSLNALNATSLSIAWSAISRFSVLYVSLLAFELFKL